MFCLFQQTPTVAKNLIIPVLCQKLSFLSEKFRGLHRYKAIGVTEITVSDIGKSPGEPNMAVSSQPGHDQRPRTATTSIVVNKGNISKTKSDLIYCDNL